jgi:hypothetical protein
MEWKEFDPAAYKLRAEGFGQLLTSRIMASVGLVIEYKRTQDFRHWLDDKESYFERSFLPTAGVSDMIFGWLPTRNVYKDGRGIDIGTPEKMADFLRSMTESRYIAPALEEYLPTLKVGASDLAEQLKLAMKDRPGSAAGINDIIPLLVPRMSHQHSILTKLPMPNTYHPGVLSTWQGRGVFFDRLKLYVKEKDGGESEQLKGIWTLAQELLETKEWMSTKPLREKHKLETEDLRDLEMTATHKKALEVMNKLETMSETILGVDDPVKS